MKTNTPSGQTAPPLRESGGRHAHSPLLKTAAAVLLLLLAAALFCGAAAADTTHTHDGITFQPWDRNDSLPDTAGKYYLTTDVTISETWTVPSGMNLCLNGHVITQTGKESVITVDGGTFTLDDCNTAAVHYFTFVENGPWTPYGGTPGASVDLKDFKLADAKAAGTGTYIVKVTGGCITGGRPTGSEPGDLNGGGVCVGEECKFTMNGGTIIGNSPVPYKEEGEIILCDARGGGVYVGRESEFIMNGGYIAGNNSPDIGGGVYVGEYGNSFTMNGGSVTGNTADTYGGGVYIGENGSFTMNDGSIKGNTAGSNGASCSGGGVYVEGTGSITMNDGSITENSAASGGGGVYLEPYGTFTIEGGSITKNNAKYNGGGVYVKGVFNVSGSPVIKDNTAEEAADNVYLDAANLLTLADNITSGEILISKVKGKQIAAGQQFGLVAEGVTEGFDKFKNDTGTLFGMMNSANHTLIWGASSAEALLPIEFKSDGGNKKTAAVTEPTSILQTVTTDKNSTVSWLVFKPHETLGDLPVTIDERDVEIVDDSFKMIVGNLKAESQTDGSTSGSPQTDTDSVTASSSGEDDIGPQPFPQPEDIEPAAGIQATLSGKLKANLIDGQENKLRLAQMTDADKWVLLPVSNGKKTGDGYYTFDAAFTSTKNGGYMFVIAEGTDPTPAPKSSSTSQGTSVWLTAEPTPTVTPAPTPTVTPTPGTDAPSVNPLPSEKPSSPAPVMGVIAGLGCAAVVFGLRRK